LFFIGFCFSLAIIFTLTMAMSRASKKIKDLAQAIALLQSQESHHMECSIESNVDSSAGSNIEEENENE